MVYILHTRKCCPMHTDGIMAYLRCSTDAQTQGDSLEIQRNKIIEFCKDKGIIVSKFYEDAGISGAVKDRPALLQLLKDCESGTIKKVFIYKYDRLAREISISLWIESVFRRHDVEVLAVQDPEFNMDDPIQRAFRHLTYVFADLERSIIMTRLKDGRVNNAKNGKRGSGPTPFAYQKVGDNLEIKPDEAQWVVKAFRWRAKGFSYSKILNQFEKSGVVNRRGKPFSIEALKYVLGNRTYFGETNFGDVRSAGTHKKIISKRLFMRVQNKFK